MFQEKAIISKKITTKSERKDAMNLTTNDVIIENETVDYEKVVPYIMNFYMEKKEFSKG